MLKLKNEFQSTFIVTPKDFWNLRNMDLDFSISLFRPFYNSRIDTLFLRLAILTLWVSSISNPLKSQISCLNLNIFWQELNVLPVETEFLV